VSRFCEVGLHFVRSCDMIGEMVAPHEFPAFLSHKPNWKGLAGNTAKTYGCSQAFGCKSHLNNLLVHIGWAINQRARKFGLSGISITNWNYGTCTLRLPGGVWEGLIPYYWDGQKIFIDSRDWRNGTKKISRVKAIWKRRERYKTSHVNRVDPNLSNYAKAVKCLKGESGHSKWTNTWVDSEDSVDWIDTILDKVEDRDVSSLANWVLELRSHWKRLSYQEFVSVIANHLSLFDAVKQQRELLIFTRFLQLFDRKFLKHWLVALRGIKALLWGQDSIGKALILALYAFSFVIENTPVPFFPEPRRVKRKIPIRIRPPVQPNAPSFLA